MPHRTRPHRTRLAPSPTGALHLGNARTFLINWALARRNEWEILLRIEDLDGPRIKEGASEEAVALLEWLGIDWDQGPTFQSADHAPYTEALRELASRGAVYPCNCTRSEIEAASLSAPHSDLHELCYPGTCRPLEPTTIAAEEMDLYRTGWRIRVPEETQSFVDQFAGTQGANIGQTVGDFQVWTKGGLPSYQLAVVVDDARQGVDHIVRGNDLLSSTPRQKLVARELGLAFAPEYWHVPLVRGEDGRRLAKRHGDTRLTHYRQSGVRGERVIGLLAEWCGIGPRTPMTAAEFARRFELKQLPAADVVFRDADDEWLRES